MAHFLLVKDSETLPLTGKEKKMRMSMLADALIDHGHRVTWFCSTFNHLTKQPYVKQDQDIAVSPNLTLCLRTAGRYKKNLSLKRLYHHRRLSYRLRTYLRDQGHHFDLIVVAHPIIDLVTEVRRFSRKNNCPFVVDVRDMWPVTFTDYCPKALRPFVHLAASKLSRQTRRSFREATELLSMSEYMRQWAVDYSQRKQSPGHVLYLGSSLPTLALDQNDQSSASSSLQCTYVGGLINSYDIDLVLQASLRAQPTDTFHIVGDGPKAAYLKTMPCADTVQFHGWYHTQQIITLFNQSDILLLPLSQQLSQCVMPNKLFDYLSAGKPILASCKGEMADLIQDLELGVVYQFGDVKGFLDGLNTLRDEAVRARMRRNIQKIYQERFLASQIYTDYAGILARLVKENPRH